MARVKGDGDDDVDEEDVGDGGDDSDGDCCDSSPTIFITIS